ncbi:MAG: T9SS C-terminal target domain-containing protein [Bacteroidetes bacterium]|nr:MAG: T9SS C-terminal target domain-containing protein [Bacteroidota bacterium]
MDAKAVWTGSTDMFPTPGNIGLVAGVSHISSTGNVTSTEQYLFNSSPKHVPGGLCAGLPGEFWMAEQVYDGSHFVDTTIVYKGVYNAATGDVDWAIHQKIRIPYDLTQDGNPYSSVPNMAFSPDGMTGYIAFAADLTGGNLAAYQPVFIKSSDAGQSWGLPTDLDLNAFPSLSDSLTVGEAGLGIEPELDMSVDVNGNLHLFVHVIGARDYDPYPYQPGDVPWHGMYDLATYDGGFSWQAWMVAPAYTFSGEFGTPDPGTGDLISMDKQPQMSRTEDGRYLFYSWVDSDTGYIGYGELNNLAPNLRIAGLAVETGLRTPAKRISDGDFLWDGRVLYPTMAPTVLTQNERFHLPIVVPEMIVNDQLSPINYWYFGNDAFIDFSELGATTDSNEPNALSHIKVFPNPIQGQEVQIQGLRSPAQFDLFDLTGRHISRQTNLGTGGTQSLMIGQLPAGLYGLRISLPDGASATYKLQKQD